MFQRTFDVRRSDTLKYNSKIMYYNKMLKVRYNLNDYTFQNWNDFLQNGIQNNRFQNVFSYNLCGNVYDLHNEVNEGTIELIINDINYS